MTRYAIPVSHFLSSRLRRGVATACGLAIVAAAWIGCPNQAAAQLADPTPSRFPQPSAEKPAWELNIKHGTPRRIVVKHTNVEIPTAYWYMTYSAVNLGRKEVTFAPEFQMLAADGKLYRGNVGIPDEVFATIKKQEKNPYLQPHREIYGRLILPGEEQAKDGVVVFAEPVLRMETFSIFMAGFSSDEQTMRKNNGRWELVTRATNLKELADVKEEDKYTIRKQYMLTYRVRGDEVEPGIDPIDKRYERWVMRP